VIPAVAAAIIAFCAATYAGPGWYEQLLRWMRPTPHALSARAHARQGPVGRPIAVSPVRPVGNDSSVSKVAQQLILVRTQPGRVAEEGFAQIGISARSPQTYRGGALLANGARLKEIRATYVVLERGSQTARLYLQNSAPPGGASPSDLLTVGGVPPPQAPGITSRDVLTDYLRPSPYFVHNQVQGYTLNPGRVQEPFYGLGLQPGDVVTQINGAPASEGEETLSALHTLLKGAALTVTIEREGIRQTLSLDGAILTKAIATGPETARHFSGIDPMRVGAASLLDAHQTESE
jgi:hypothetical protein